MSARVRVEIWSSPGSGITRNGTFGGQGEAVLRDVVREFENRKQAKLSHFLDRKIKPSGVLRWKTPISPGYRQRLRVVGRVKRKCCRKKAPAVTTGKEKWGK
eukprot:IDg6442t1